MSHEKQHAASAYDASQISPVSQPGANITPPEPYTGIYPMPMFMTLTSDDMEESERFWSQGLGFISLYTMPGMMIHMRGWAFQDVLIRKRLPGADNAHADIGPIGSLRLAVTETQIGEMIDACERLRPGSTTPPTRKPWNSIETTISTPGGLALTLTPAVVVDKQ